MEALRGVAILPGPRSGTHVDAAASGLAIKIEDGDGYDRGTWAASVEALRQAGVLDGRRSGRSPATTARPSSTRTAASGPRRSPSSSSRPSASSSADGAAAGGPAERLEPDLERTDRWPPTPIRIAPSG